MALDNFIPEVWSNRLLLSLKRRLVYGQPGVVNRDYEGDIQEAGDTVRITSIGPVTVNNYTKNSDILPPQELEDAQAILQITQQKYFNFQIDDIDDAQGRPDVMDAAMSEAAYALSLVADAYIASKYTEASAANLLGSDGTPETPEGSDGTAYASLVELSVLLTEANVDAEGRWIIVPPWFLGELSLDDRFVMGATAQSTSNLMNGVQGRIAGFNVLVSNSVPNTSGTLYKIMAGVPGAITFAEQIRKIEAYRPERRFADALKGLHLYGAKVIRPEMLAVMTANRPS